MISASERGQFIVHYAEVTVCLGLTSGLGAPSQMPGLGVLPGSFPTTIAPYTLSSYHRLRVRTHVPASHTLKELGHTSQT